MFRHNLLITWRGFMRHKSTFLINLIGLSAGLACALMIYLWVYDETSVDNFHEKDSQLYQVMHNNVLGQGIETADHTPSPLPAAWKAEMPEVEYAVQTTALGPDGLLSHGEKAIETRAFFAGPDFFRVFSYSLLQGDPDQSLKSQNGVILSESLANRLFGTTENVIGKSLEWEQNVFSGAFQVAGLVADAPVNSTMQFELIFPYQVFLDHTKDWETGEWYTAAGQTYLILQKGTDIDRFNAKIADYLKPKSRWTVNSMLFVQPYSQRYLHGRYQNGRVAGGRITYVRLFSIIGLFILLIACINFMNLSTAQASRRMKEIGVKKAIGSGRKALVIQYLSESLIMAVLSFAVAIILMGLLLPKFSLIIGKDLSLPMNLGLFFTVLGIVVLTGLLAGSYPALYLSGFDPVSIFKGKRVSVAAERRTRKGLVVFQFALSVIFIVSVLVINQQIRYAQTRNLGFERDHILTFQLGANEGGPEVFLNELQKVPGISMASNMVGSIFSNVDAQSGYNWNETDTDEDYLFKAPMVGYDVIETLGMEMAAGRSFSREYNDDATKIIINESALKMMQLEDPIGYRFDKDVGHGREEREIIGVVKDFQYGSIHHSVEPLILRFRNFGATVLAKVQSGTAHTAIEQIEELYKGNFPDENFAYRFLDEDYQALYQAESKVALLTTYASGLAVLISCLGLLGLAVFSTERRVKEIGIRKVLGASVWNIVHLLSRDFTKMVLMGIGLAIPLSYLIARDWLGNFAYQVDLNWWLFAGAAGLTLLIAWLTVSWQTLQAARANPVTALKSE